MLSQGRGQPKGTSCNVSGAFLGQNVEPSGYDDDDTFAAKRLVRVLSRSLGTLWEDGAKDVHGRICVLTWDTCK